MPEGETFFDRRERAGDDHGGPPERKRGLAILSEPVIGNVPGWAVLMGGAALAYYFLVWRPASQAKQAAATGSPIFAPVSGSNFLANASAASFLSVAATYPRFVRSTR